MLFGKKEIEAKCKNCLLFNRQKSTCGVAILHEGEQIHLPVEASDDCFFEGEFIAIEDGTRPEIFKPEVQEVKWWVEDPDDKGNGTVKIQYPDGFFGKNEK